MPVENATQRIWFWFNISPTIPGMEYTRCFQKDMVKLLKIYDKEMGIIWTWPLSIDSISVKSPLGGRKQETILLPIEANWTQKDIF